MVNVFKVEKNSINYILMLRCEKMSAKLFINSDDFMPETNFPSFQNKVNTAKGCIIYFIFMLRMYISYDSLIRMF